MLSKNFKKPEAILICRPATNYLSADVYCCIIWNSNLNNESILSHLNLHYSSFTDAINLIAIGEIDDLLRMQYNKNKVVNNCFSSLNKAKESLKDYDLYFYDMSERKYKWIKLESETSKTSQIKSKGLVQ